MPNDNAESGLIQLEEECRLQYERPANGDKRIASYSEAARQQLEENPKYRDLIRSVILERPDISVPQLFSLPLRSLQGKLMELPRSTYPETFDEARPWAETIEFATEPDSPLHEAFVYDLKNRNIQSNVSERYKAPLMVANLMRDRLGERPSVLDVGCSRGHGLKRMAAVRRFPFSKVTAEQLVIDSAGNVADLVPDHDATRAAQFVVNQRFRLGGSLGIDIEPAEGEDVKKWARACSFYPSALLDKRAVKKYDQLDAFDHKNVDFYQADFSDLDIEKFEAEAPVSSFDIVTFSTVLYQVSEDKREAMFENAKRLLNPNGIIIIQDFVGIDPDDANKLHFYQNWFKEPYIYRTILLDPKIENGQLLEIFRWDNGRCNKLLTGSDIDRIVPMGMRALREYSRATSLYPSIPGR